MNKILRAQSPATPLTLTYPPQTVALSAWRRTVGWLLPVLATAIDLPQDWYHPLS